MKIAIEGMDGVGKSTIAKKIAENYGMTYIEKPLTEIFEIDSLPGKDNLSKVSTNIYNQDSEIIKAWFFGMGNILTFLKYKDSDLVIDRHFASNYFWNGTEKSNPVFKTMIEIIGKPDVTILLRATVETRIERLYKRNPSDYDLSDSEKHVYGYDKMIKFLNDFQIPYVIIDTDNKNIDEVYLEVENVIKQIKSKDKVRKLIK